DVDFTEDLDDGWDDELPDDLDSEFEDAFEDELDVGFEDALNAHPLEFARACLRAAAPLLAAEEFDQALELFDLAGDLTSPDVTPAPESRALYGEALAGQAACSEALGQLEIAIDNMESAAYPANESLAATEEDGDLALTLRHADLLDRAAAAHDAEHLHEEAQEFYRKAIVRYVSLRRRDPSAVSQERLSRARLNAGISTSELGDTAGALDEFDAAIEELRSQPADAAPAVLLAELHQQRGWALADLERSDDALAAFRTSVSIADAAPAGATAAVAPVAVRALVQLGLVLERAPNQDEALATYARAAERARAATAGQDPEALGALREAEQALAGLLGRTGRFEEALIAADANVAAAAALLAVDPSAARVGEYFLAWFTKATVLQLQDDDAQLMQGFAEATNAWRALAEAGLPAAADLWQTVEVDAVERLSSSEQFAAAEQHLATALQLTERIAAESPRSANASKLLRVRTVQAELLHQQGQARRALPLLDQALTEYTRNLGFADAASGSLHLAMALEVKSELLKAMGRDAEARAIARRATQMQGQTSFQSLMAPPGEQLAPGVRLNRSIGTATLSASDIQGGPPLATVLLDHHAIAGLRSDLRGWSGANWVNPERTLQVRSPGKERPIELSFRTLGGQELRHALSDEESATLRSAIEELYEEGRVR
ncbi:MAG: hypothetical protein ACYDCQ_17140, partial [Dehalococcoidia bacterium]